MDYFWGIGGLILLFILGLLMLFKPEFLWKLEHLFTVKSGSPTDLYITLMRLGGIVFTLTAAVAAAVLLLKYIFP